FCLGVTACGASLSSDPAEDQSEAATACSTLTASGVTASGNDGNVPSNVLDGNLSTRWSALGIGSWIQLDLGAVRQVCSVSIAWYRGDLRKNNFVIQLSSDGSAFTTVFQGQSSGTTLALSPYSFTPASGRYVRIVVNGNTENNWASITEARVAGT